MWFILVVIVILLVVLLYKQQEQSKNINELTKLLNNLSSEKREAPTTLLKTKKTDSSTEPPHVALYAPSSDTQQTISEKEPSQIILQPEESKVIPPKITVSEQAQPPAVPTPKKERKKIDYEKYIGENLFGKIGILIFVIGIGLFVKYAIDQEWIDETFRTILGFATGSALLAIAERLRKHYRTFSSLLAGGAFGVFYLTVAIAFHYYHLFSQTAAFVILIAVTAFMVALSILYDRRELAIIALVGGFLAPFIVSSDTGSYIALFTYLSILNLGMFALSFYKKWREISVVSFVFTYLIVVFYLITADYQSVALELFGFITLFYFIFLLPVLSILRFEGGKINKVLLSVIVSNNFGYLFLGIILLEDVAFYFNPKGLLSLFIAIVNLILTVSLFKRKEDFKLLIYSTLGLVLTFVSITIPLQLSGNYITLFWASEMVLLLWLYIKSNIKIYQYATVILVLLTFISYLIDLYFIQSDYSFYVSEKVIFFNRAFATSLFVGLAAAAFATLMNRYRTLFVEFRWLKRGFWERFMIIVSILVIYSAFTTEFDQRLVYPVCEAMKLLFTAITIAGLSYGFRKRIPMEKYAILYLFGMGLNTLLFLFNVWDSYPYDVSAVATALLWADITVVAAYMWHTARLYYKAFDRTTWFTIYLCLSAILIWMTLVRAFLCQIGYPDDFNVAFSVSLSIAGLVQMVLGMRLHQKVVRIISLSAFGIVLLKLVAIDLWEMSSLGKIIVFIILGVILLVLSFLYQKLKDVLFKNDTVDKN